MKNASMPVLAAILAAISMSANGVSLAAPGQERQKAVAERGARVMPFDLHATTHVFTKTPTGGVQQVVAKRAGDAGQIRLIREHLGEIAGRFSKGDFSAPSHLHGADMPGLAQLQQAGPGEIDIRYQQTKTGAQLVYTAKKPELVTALHQWFGAQLSDHGKDAMQGHDHGAMHR